MTKKQMMPKILVLALFCGLLTPLWACGKDKTHSENAIAAEETTEKPQAPCPDISQIRSICELATLECYYHNVAISTKEKGQGLSHIGEKDREFWIEYSGVAKLGVNMANVNMEIQDKEIVITIPKAQLLGLSDYTFSPDSYISEDDGINKNPITPENQTQAVAKAQEDIRQRFSKDDAMLMRAQERAKSLIENYIQKLSEIWQADYQVTFMYD
ncbi:MAG: DUF4230 domain-containing protein [Lachnospiraceae bacterium]|nr:DUF4230 domain-containing protein [Lachnospiraceae bacterium]MDE6979941.1 DUF4230 domain-containing protein [Lachnospiraceae bacterium]